MIDKLRRTAPPGTIVAVVEGGVLQCLFHNGDKLPLVVIDYDEDAEDGVLIRLDQTDSWSSMDRDVLGSVEDLFNQEVQS